MNVYVNKKEIQLSTTTLAFTTNNIKERKENESNSIISILQHPPIPLPFIFYFFSFLLPGEINSDIR